MDNNVDILAKINEKYPKMSKGQKAIASFIYEHYEQAVFMTAARLGNTIGVSESTVVRFASMIGYKGYPEFQRDLEEWVQNKINAVQKINVRYGNSSESEIVSAVLGADIEKIQDTLEKVDPMAFDMAADLMLNSEHVYVIGLRSCEPLAAFLNFYLCMMRGNVTLLNSTSVSELFEQMIHINEKDVLVGISFPRYSMRTLKAMEFANDRMAKVIAITDSMHSPMNLYSSCNLFARSDMVSIVDSLVAPLSLINALVVSMCMKAPEQVQDNMKTLSEVWNNYQVYLNDEINFINETPILNNPIFKNKYHPDGTAGTLPENGQAGNSEQSGKQENRQI
jgi:DNA-binding MurR/RpiR family transcriptional regulator